MEKRENQYLAPARNTNPSPSSSYPMGYSGYAVPAAIQCIIKL